MQKTRALQLMREAGLENWDQACGRREIEMLEAVLPQEFQLKVYTKEWFSRLYYPENKDTHQRRNAPNIITLYLYNGHYDIVNSIPAFLGHNYWCDHCETGYNEKDKHHCHYVCPHCKQPGKCTEDRHKDCPDCGRWFVSQICYDRHKEIRQQPASTRHRGYDAGPTSTCQQVKLCQKCSRSVYSLNNHSCGLTYCAQCKKKVPSEDMRADVDGVIKHQCYISKIEKKKKKKQNRKRRREEDVVEEEAIDEDEDDEEGIGEQEDPTYVFFDFECSQDKLFKEGDGFRIPLHRLVCAHARLTCPICIDQPTDDCTVCEEKLFFGKDALDKFCSWLFAMKKRTIAIAHNMKGYDGQFVLNWLHKNSAVPPKPICRGSELIMIKVANISVKDSLNFIPSRLAEFPKAFGITEMKKGYFPYLFIKEANFNYIGPLPPKEDFCYNTMKTEEIEKFEQWYEEERKKPFNYREEMEAYVKSDTLLLKEVCRHFRTQFKDFTNGIDPFQVSCTIASACNYLFRALFLENETIGLIPPGGYRKRFKTSVVETKYLDWLEHTDNIQLERQVLINAGGHNYRVDGYHRQTNTVIEFNGQIWHGCPKCLKNRNTKLPGSEKTVEDAWQATELKRIHLEESCYTVRTCWECCDLKPMLEQNDEMAAYFDNHTAKDPLDPRKGFFGGRTNATKLQHVCENGEKCIFVDVTSLYPTVNKYDEVPIGHPNVITSNFEPLAKHHQPYFGMIKCTILPPRGLLHPLLPMKANGKLMFTLCRRCAIDENQQQCQHSDNDRMLDGEWCSIEIDKALQLGYKVIKVYEVYHFTRRTRNLFAPYINLFLKRKTESSGWPKDVVTEEQKSKYIDDFLAREAVQLDAPNMIKNNALRTLSKLCLNSFWGKFGQRDNLPTTDYFDNAEDFFSVIFDDRLQIHAVRIINENLMMVTYSSEDEYIEGNNTVNPVIAAFTTAHARLRLYSYLEQLQDGVIYFDTDSIIYISRPTDTNLPTGNFLGDLKDELEDYGQGAYISQFVSGGPKNYAFEVTIPGKEAKMYKHKVKGITNNHQTAQMLNFHTMQRHVQKYMENDPQVLEIPQTRIARTKDRQVVTLAQKKKYRIVYNKRAVQPDSTTLPYGY